MACLLMIIFGLNYENNLVLGVSLFFFSVFIVSQVISYKNIRGISIKVLDNKTSIFAGTSINIPIFLHKNIQQTSYTITVNSKDTLPVFIDTIQNNCTTSLTINNIERGYYNLSTIKVYSTYPLGLIEYSAYIESEHNHIVFPKPIPNEYTLVKISMDNCFNNNDLNQQSSSHNFSIGVNDEISGLKQYREGDPINLIDWRQLALKRGLMVKEFTTDQSMNLYLTEQSIKSLEIEEQISMLTYAILDLEKRNAKFGFKFKSINFSPSSGKNYTTKLLTELALL
ncbi:MAG: DUF58 domain-containing protein [Succinivibrionaceae bacterium]